MKNILCYGDSNTWGFTPVTAVRYPADVRWTGVVQKLLGAEYHIIENGINGRTTVWDEPTDQCRNGLTGLGYALYSAKPLDLVVVMLGTNDLKFTDAEGYYLGIKLLAQRIVEANIRFPGSSDVFPDKPRLLLVSPILLGEVWPAYPMSCEFAHYTEKVAKELNIPWLNAADYAEPSQADGCHMDEENHRKLAEAMAAKIKEII